MLPMDFFEEYNPADFATPPPPWWRVPLSRSPSIELYPNFDAEYIVRPRIDDPPPMAMEVVVGGSDHSDDDPVALLLANAAARVEELVPPVVAQDPVMTAAEEKMAKDREIMEKMSERVKRHIYTDPKYGKRNCLWSPKMKNAELPQKVSSVPESYVLFKSVRAKDVDHFLLPRKWEKAKARGKAQKWKTRVEELKREQRVQIAMGAVVICGRNELKEWKRTQRELSRRGKRRGGVRGAKRMLLMQ